MEGVAEEATTLTPSLLYTAKFGSASYELDL